MSVAPHVDYEPVNGTPQIDERGRPIFRHAVSRTLADIVERPVEWTWQDRIVRGAPSLIAGLGGVGKSSLMCDLIGRLTNTGMMPDRTRCPIGDVIIATGEESYEFTIKARCRMAGADMNRVHTIEGLKTIDESGASTEIAYDLNAVHALDEMVRFYTDTVAIFIDPIGAFIGGRTDANTDNAVRAVLQPTSKLLAERNIAGVFLAHHRKAASNNADDLVLGSRAMTAAMRSVYHVFDDNGRKLMLPGKGNLSPVRTGLAYTINRVEGECVGRLEWDTASVMMDANTYLAEQSRPGPPAEGQQDAAEWLNDALQAGPLTKQEIKDKMKADDCPFAWKTAQRAFMAAKVKVERNPHTKAWQYRLLRDGNNDPQKTDAGQGESE